MAFEGLTNDAKELYDNIQDLAKSNLEYYKLDLFRKSAKGTIALIKVLVLSSVFMFFILFLSMALGFWIGDAIGDIAAGFFIVAGIYLLLLFLAYLLCKTYVEKLVLKKLSSKFFKEKKEV